jgi:hypothetical protein
VRRPSVCGRSLSPETDGRCPKLFGATLAAATAEGRELRRLEELGEHIDRKWSWLVSGDPKVNAGVTGQRKEKDAPASHNRCVSFSSEES